MYPTLIALHSWGRWALLIAGVAAVVTAFAARSKTASPGMDKSAKFFVILADVELLLGILLGFATPWFSVMFGNPGTAMGDPMTRFWGMEHALGMIIAVVLIHVGRVRGRKAANFAGRAKAYSLWFAFALLIMLATIPWPFMKYGRPLFRI